jgi:hypothetical protein
MTRISTFCIVFGALAVLALSATAASAETIGVRAPTVSLPAKPPPKTIQLDSIQYGIGQSLNSSTGSKSNREGAAPTVSQINISGKLKRYRPG